MYTNVNPHYSQPEKAGDDAKLNKVAWKVIMSWGIWILVRKCISHAKVTFEGVHVTELGEGKQEKSCGERNAMTAQSLAMQVSEFWDY